jgi:hypothetical protein
MNSTTEKDQVIETINLLFIHTDNRDWEKVEALFTESVVFDMQSVTGARASIMTAREIAGGWETGLKPLKALHHQAGNFLVNIVNNEATVFCYGVAWHYLPNKSGRNTRTFVGSYDMHLLKLDGGWKIDRFKYNLKFIDGNADLEKSAAEKAA